MPKRPYSKPEPRHHPVLLISGEADPITPPIYAQKDLDYLSNKQHLIVMGGGHINSIRGCIPDLIDKFLTSPEVKLDQACVKDIHRPPFMIGAYGPELDRRGGSDSKGMEQGGAAVIRVNSVSKQFSGTPVLKNLNFSIADGQITALLGANGAGKTTCLRIITGLLKADSGHAYVGGLEVSKYPKEIRRQLGVVGDREGLYERLTVAEYLSFFASAQGLAGDKLEFALQSVREELELSSLWNRRTKGFSQGERMKVSLARALVHRPSHLILDEPTRGLDVLAARLLRRTLLNLRSEGTAILFSSHIMAEVVELSDTVLIMANGTIVDSGTPGELNTRSGSNNLEDSFVKLAYGQRAGKSQQGEVA
ncbi:ATP-binding cassette domain-containing protein [Microbulbifer sp. MLAF003]|uniref:ATP-binding cassette domain-containing protein n=1 Tax=Microbulbifer sp. MLAF003 TaxID=3032582 RepID=UPI0024AE36B3|nr:ATP-binding cassette domain-containing protein [Microbulbifer sp. MLAF003]WHI50807.1 ATP-binding cassette domain-containing protein [Microbulbifer sp. MLAF003]